jgi:hypothetical protein
LAVKKSPNGKIFFWAEKLAPIINHHMMSYDGGGPSYDVGGPSYDGKNPSYDGWAHHIASYDAI